MRILEKIKKKNIQLPKWYFWLFVLLAVILIGYIDFLELGFLKKMFGDINILAFLNSNSGAVQGMSTFALVGITAFYAIQAHKTNSLISMQIFPNIFLESVKLHSSLLDAENIKRTKKCMATGSIRQIHHFDFILNYSVVNHSASSGTVEKPRLLVRSPKGNRSKLLLPYAEKEASGEIANTIYLRAGETKNMEEAFSFSITFCKNSSNDDMDFINDAMSLRYKILYKNVIGKQLSITLEKENVLPLND